MKRLAWIACSTLLGCFASLLPAFSQSASSLTAPQRVFDCERASNCFHIRSFHGGPSAASVLQQCECLRGEMQQAWGVNAAQSWEPKCEVVLHPDLASYLRAVGPGASQTQGCSQIEFAAGQITKRRIDLRVECDGTTSALAHELTHVVLADCFGGRQPPPWLDEGVAMLADTHDKQLLHHRDCLDALATGRSLPLQQLLYLNGFSSPDQMPAFYGQSLSLVQMLAHQDKPQRIIDFALDSMSRGYPQALQTHYGISSIPELEGRWKAFAASQARARGSSLRSGPFSTYVR